MREKLQTFRRLAGLLLFLTLLWNSSTAQLAGTPPYLNLIVGGQADNAFPLQSATNNVQWIYGPGAFYAGGVSTGMPANPGKITKVYWQIGATASSSVAYSNFTIKLGQPAALATATTFPSAGWITGLTTVFQQTSFTITGASSGAFIEIPLQMPFIYDPTKALVFEMYVTGGSGNQTRQYGGTGNQRQWGTAVNTGVPSAGAGLARFGFEVLPNGGNDIGVSAIDSPTTFCGGPQSIVARVQNFGNNQVSGFNVNWSINGTLQTPISSTAVLDTFNGTFSTWTQVSLNSAYTFPSTPTIIKAWTSSPNAVADTSRNNDSSTVVKQPSVQGSFTIDPAGSGATNFTSFAAAINALSVAGVCGPVNFTVAPGTYTGQIVIGNIAGASAINNITFDGVNPINRILTENLATSAVVLMNSSKFITFKNFTVTNSNATSGVGIGMVGSVTNIKIINNRVNVAIQTGTASSGYGIIATGTAGGNGASGMSGDSILIDNNIVTGGGYSITVYGSSSASANRGIVVTNNTVINSNYMGGYIAYNYNPVIVKNNKFNMNGFQYGYYGLYFYYNQSNNTTINHEIIGNTINGFGGYGIYLYWPLATTTAAKVKCHSNIVTSSLGGTYPGLYGIYLYQYNAACNAEIYHNTVSLNGNTTSTANTCFYNTGSTNTMVKNNIFAVYGGTATPMYLITSPAGSNVNYNIYYNATNPASGNLVYRGTFFNPSNFMTITAGGDSSINTNPSFFTRTPLPGNLHLTDGCNGYGTDLRAFVPYDIDGDTFSITPTIGADQFTGGVNDNLRLMRILTPNAPIVSGAQDVSFIVKNIGANTVSSYNASYRLNTTAPVSIIRTNSVAACSVDTVLFTGTDQVTLGAVNNMTYYTSLPNTNPDADATNDTVRTTLLAPLSGVYTVGGTTPNYATIIDAANALVNGVSGPVTFEIRPGTYTGQVVVNGPIPGTSATNTITFEGNDKSTRTVTSSTAGAAFLINNTSFVTVQNLTITNTNTASPVGFAAVSAGLSSTMKGITIKRCNINLPIQSGTSSIGNGINFTGTANGTGFTSCGADSSIIDSNVVTGGGYAIAHYGSQNANFNRGVMIRGNTLNNINYMGIYAYYNYNPMVVNNNIINMQGQNYGYYGIYHYFNQSNNTTISHEINGNRINNFGGYGLYCYYPINSATAAKTKIYNNIIIGGTGSSYPGYYGLYLYQANAAFNADVYHNVVAMNGSVTSTTYSAFYQTGSTLTNVKNNIFVTNTPTYTPAYYATSPGASNVNFNVYYNASNPTTGTLGFRNGVFFTPATYKTTTAGGDSSFNLNPPFVGGGNYNLTNACLRGTNLFADVPTDFAGNTRSTSPNIGAYEAATAALDITPVMLLSPTFPVGLGSQDLQVVVRNNGATAVTSFDLTYKLNNGTAVTTTFTGNLPTCDTVSVYFTGAQQINLVNAQNTLQLYTSAPNLGFDGLPSNDTLVVNLSTPLSGNYIVGAAPSDYLTFNAANNALKTRGANGVVNFMVKTGTYNEQLVLSAYPGSTNPANIVSFNSIANNADSVSLEFNSVGAPEPSVVKYNGVNGINFNFISIKQLAVATTGTYYTIQFIGMNNFDTINSCKISMPVYSPTNTVGSYTVFGNGMSGNGIALKNSIFTGSYYGLYLYASAAARLDNILIEGNTFSNAYYAPVYYLYYTRYAKFLNNNINITSVNGQTTNYMYFYYNDSGYTATGNRFTSTGVTTYWYNYYSNNNLGRKGLVANNTYSTNTAIYHYFGNSITANLDIVNNSFSMGTGYLYIASSGLNNVRILNNVIFGTGTYSYYWSAAPLGLAASDYNNIFSSGSTTPIYAVAARTLQTFRSTYLKDLNSVSYRPGYTSNTNLVPNVNDSAVWSINGRGTFVPEVGFDINNNSRPILPSSGVPDIGAFQFTPVSTPPLCTAIPATPIAGGTQVFLFAQDTVARITWDALTTPPTSVQARAYSGTIPPSIAPATDYMYYYANISAPSGSYLYDMNLHYKPEWMGTIANKVDLRLAKFDNGSGWVAYSGALSSVDSVRGVISSLGLTTFSLFTGSNDNSPLPVTLIKFNGQKVDVAAHLAWSTVSEKNSSVFNIERSFDSKEFETIGGMDARGNSNSLVNYSFNDETAFISNPEVVYYRLKMIDRDGSFEYSKTIAVRAEDETKTPVVKVYPNPFNSEVIVENIPTETKEIKLLDLSGRVVFIQKISNAEGTVQVILPASLESGIYFMMLDGSSNELIKLIKN